MTETNPAGTLANVSRSSASRSVPRNALEAQGIARCFAGIIAKRLQLHLRSVAWFITVLLIAVLFGTSARRATAAFDLDAAAFDADQLAHLQDADRVFHTYAEIEVAVDRRPAALRLLARGFDDSLPSCAIVGGLFGPTVLRTRQTTLALGPLSLDPAHVLGLFGSLLALLVTCDTIGREREQGTLQLLLTYPLRRGVVLLGEYFAAMIVVFVPVVACVLLFLTTAGATGRVTLGRDVLVSTAIFLLALGLLISTAVAVGLLIASSIRSPATALTVGLFVWAAVGVIYPAIAPALARILSPVETVTNPATSSTLGRYWHESKSDAPDARTTERLLQERIAQASTFRKIAFGSPYSTYAAAAESSVGTSLKGYRVFLESVDRVTAQFIRWQAEKLRQYPTRGTSYTMDDAPLDTTGLISNQVATGGGQNADAAVGIAVLAIWNTIILCATFVGFSRYDPRP